MSAIFSQALSNLPASSSATYSCRFDNNWSGTNHPAGYPDNAHWSPPVIAAHSKDYSLWKPGEMASAGVVEVAQSGMTGTVNMELDEAAAMGEVGERIQGEVTFNNMVQFQVFDTITLTPSFPFMSAVTMIAPSSDWFSGFYDVKPIDEDAMVWYDEFEIEAAPWDAGSREGEDFVGGGESTNPRMPIMEFTAATVPSSGAFLNAEKDDVLPMGTWTCTLVTESMTKSDKKAKAGKKAKKAKKERN